MTNGQYYAILASCMAAGFLPRWLCFVSWFVLICLAACSHVGI